MASDQWPLWDYKLFFMLIFAKLDFTDKTLVIKNILCPAARLSLSFNDFL